MPDSQLEKINLRFKEARMFLRLGQVAFANKAQIKQSQVSEIESGKRNITPAIFLSLEDNLKISRKWLETGEGEMILNSKPESNAVLIGEIQKGDDDNESPYIDLGNGQFLMVVPLIPIKASSGYRNNFQDEGYIDTHYDKHYFPVTRQYRGRYFAFVNEGDSMENYTTEEFAKKSIPEGAIITGREIPKHHWKNKFHLKSFDRYIIVHRDVILTKVITEHDTEKGLITCHSLNPDKVRHPDFILSLDECLQVLNIVNVSNAV